VRERRHRFGPGAFSRIERFYDTHATTTGWWLPYPSEKYEFVSWDYYGLLFPIYGKMFQTTNQMTVSAVSCCHQNWIEQEMLQKKHGKTS
jgi:hypothetical protein